MKNCYISNRSLASWTFFLTFYTVVIVANNWKRNDKIENQAKDNQYKSDAINHCRIKLEAIDQILSTSIIIRFFALDFFDCFWHFNIPHATWDAVEKICHTDGALCTPNIKIMSWIFFVITLLRSSNLKRTYKLTFIRLNVFVEQAVCRYQ